MTFSLILFFPRLAMVRQRLQPRRLRLPVTWKNLAGKSRFEKDSIPWCYQSRPPRASSKFHIFPSSCPTWSAPGGRTIYACPLALKGGKFLILWGANDLRYKICTLYIIHVKYRRQQQRQVHSNMDKSSKTDWDCYWEIQFRFFSSHFLTFKIIAALL